MPNSQNGYSVIDRDDCKWYDVTVGELPFRPDDCGWVMAHFFRQFHARVEPLRITESFGHALRRIGGSSEWSNHASGTAGDANSTDHRQGATGTFTFEQLNSLRELLDDYDGVIKWGGDYRVTKDEMHFEIDKPYEEVNYVARRLRKNNVVAVSRLKPGNRNMYVYMVKRALAKKGLYNGTVNNYFGVGLRNAYKAWQQSLGYTGDDADGLPGVTSLGALGFKTK